MMKKATKTIDLNNLITVTIPASYDFIVEGGLDDPGPDGRIEGWDLNDFTTIYIVKTGRGCYHMTGTPDQVESYLDGMTIDNCQSVVNKALKGSRKPSQAILDIFKKGKPA